MKYLTQILLIAAVVIFFIFGFSMCGRYKERIDNLVMEKELLRAERDSIGTLYADLETRTLQLEDSLSQSLVLIQNIKKERAAIERSYKKRIAELNSKTPDQIHQMFDSTYPTLAEGPLHTIISDQARQAVSTKIELDHIKEDLSLANNQIVELNKMVSLQAEAIGIKDEQLVLKQREIDLIEKRYEGIIKNYDALIKQKERQQRIERLTGITSIGLLLALLIFT